MADPRKATRTIVLKDERRQTVKIEMFCATMWPDAPGARPGLVRLRVDGKWFYDGVRRYTFFNVQGVTTLVGAILAGKGMELSQPSRPELPRGSTVSVPNGKVLAGQLLYDRTRTASEPIIGIDGRWYVAVTMYGRGTIHVPVDELGE